MLPEAIQLNIKNESRRGNAGNGVEFPQDKESDLCMMVGSKIFPLHRSCCTKSRLITEGIEPTDKFFLLDDCRNINEQIIERTLQIFYGRTLYLQSHNDLAQTLTIIEYLQIDEVNLQIEEQLLRMFHQCDLFFVLNLAYLHHMRRLYNQCFQELQIEEFQQMLYNKFDLMNCDFKLFQIVLHTHKSLQSKGKINGVSADEVQEILKLYCAANHYNQETFDQLFFRYGKMKVVEAINQKQNVEKKTVQVETVPLAELVRKDGIISNIYEAKQEEEDAKESEQKKTNEKEPQDQENKEPEKQNPNNFPFKAITRQSTDAVTETAPASPAKKRTNTRRMSLHIDSLGLQSFPFSHSKPLNRSVNIEEELEQKSSESGEQGGSVENNFEVNHDEDADILQMKISHMLDRYENAYQEHDKNFQLMKQNYGMKSVMMNQEEEPKGNRNLFVTRDFQMEKKIGHRIFPSLAESIFDTNKLENTEKPRTPRD